MSRAPAVSVVMATYNVAPFVREAVDSVLQQTFTDWELIVVDDGSTDRTPTIVAGYTDPRIRLFRLPHHGAPATLNRGVAEAQGELVAMLDGDDRWLPEKLERHIALLRERPEVDMTFDWSRMIEEDGRITGKTARQWRGPISFTELFVDYVIGNGSAIVMRRAALAAAGPYDTNLGGCYDLDVTLRIARQRPANICAVEHVLTDYRRRAGQLTRDVRMMEANWLAVQRKVAELEPERVQTAGRRAGSNIYRFFSYAAYENGSMALALRYCARSFAYQPAAFLSDPRNWALGAVLLSALILPRGWQKTLLHWAVERCSA